MENTPKKGQYRWLVFKKGEEWIAAALEFNIVEVGDDPKKVLYELEQSVRGYIEAASEIKGFRSQLVNQVLNQSPEEEYEKLWYQLMEQSQKREPVPSYVFDFGTRNLAVNA